jgi:hypothetical protein
MNKILPAQAEVHTIHLVDIDPDRGEREESAEFRAAKDRLKEDGHYKCYICSGTDNLQSHHRGAEYKFRNITDFELLKQHCEEWDIYGYGRLLKNKPITTVDDIRCQMILCQEHHTGVDHEDGSGAIGIHFAPFPEWIMQKLCLPGCNPIPQKGETIEQAIARVKANQRKEGEGNR